MGGRVDGWIPIFKIASLPRTVQSKICLDLARAYARNQIRHTNIKHLGENSNLFIVKGDGIYSYSGLIKE
jgi:hypothetical protein